MQSLQRLQTEFDWARLLVRWGVRLSWGAAFLFLWGCIHAEKLDHVPFILAVLWGYQGGFLIGCAKALGDRLFMPGIMWVIGTVLIVFQLDFYPVVPFPRHLFWQLGGVTCGIFAGWVAAKWIRP